MLQQGGVMGLSNNVCVVPVVGAKSDYKNAKLGTLFMEKYYITYDLTPVIEQGNKFTIMGCGPKETNYPFKIREQQKKADQEEAARLKAIADRRKAQEDA